MALSFKQAAKSAAPGDTSPVSTANFAGAAVAGDLIVVYIGMDGGVTGTITSVTDTGGNTYTAVPSFEVAGSSCALNCYYAKVVTGGTSFHVNVNFNATSTDVSVAAQEFQGFVGTPTFDIKKTQVNASSTTATSGASAATTVANEIVVGGAVHTGTVSAYTLGTGYTNLTDVSIANMETGMESAVISSTGAQTATFTIAAARANIGALVTFYDAATGPSPSVGDTATTSETKTLQMVSFVNKADTGTTSETVSVVSVNQPNTGDTTTTSETVKLQLVSSVNVGDTTTTSETVTPLIPTLLVTPGDTATTSENVNLQIVSFVNVGDTATTSETVALFIPTYPVSVGDTATTSETVATNLRIGIDVEPSNPYYTIQGVKVVG